MSNHNHSKEGCCGACSAHDHGNEHEHHHHHDHDGSMKGKLTLIGVAAVLLVVAALIERYAGLATWQLLLVYLVPYLLVAHDTLKEAWEGITSGDVFN